MTDSPIEKASSPQELLDLVDENDQIIGEVRREIANSDPTKFHREVGIVLLQNSEKEYSFLWQKRSKYKTVHPGKWSITAGHVAKGEEPEKTAHIELQEELGFNTDLFFITKKLNRYTTETHFMYYFIGLYEGQEIKIEPAELETTAFFTLDQLQDMVKKGENVNTTHFLVLEELLAGKYNVQIERLLHANN